ncbi:sulfotransferase family protein [Aquipuribacter sp. SD81]|uniref:sulfotransferase family protein n=1 Tax=Aquipuribacter sp. SD81 TaxID=3127703 RepID=UPI00301777A5
MAERLPTFLLVGAMKAGTTSLHGYLSSHPDVFMSPNKEPDYFVLEKTWSRGEQWYREQFRDARDEHAVGEASTSYTKCTEFAGVPERAVSLLPDVRVVYLLRDPVERIRSMYLHNVIVGREHRPLPQAVLSDPMYLDASRYAMQLSRWDAVLPPERVLTVLSEHLRADAAGVLARTGRFLGVDPSGFDLSPQRHNDTATRRKDTPATRLVRSLPGYRHALRLAPQPLVRALRTATTRTLPEADGVLDDTTRARLLDALAPDLERLRDRIGDDIDRWRLAPRPSARADGERL